MGERVGSRDCEGILVGMQLGDVEGNEDGFSLGEKVRGLVVG